MKIFQHKRYGDIFIGSRLNSNYSLLDRALGCKDDRRNMGRAQIFLHGLHDLKAVFPRQHNVANNQIWHDLKSKSQTCSPIVSFLYIIYALKAGLDKLPK